MTHSHVGGNDNYLFQKIKYLTHFNEIYETKFVWSQINSAIEVNNWNQHEYPFFQKHWTGKLGK